jgi:hypothetical protein
VVFLLVLQLLLLLLLLCFWRSLHCTLAVHTTQHQELFKSDEIAAAETSKV